MREAAVQQGREEKARQTDALPRTDTELHRPHVQRPTDQLNEPDQGEEAKRYLDRQAEVGTTLLGAGEARIGCWKVHSSRGKMKTGHALRARRSSNRGAERSALDRTRVAPPVTG